MNLFNKKSMKCAAASLLLVFLAEMLAPIAALAITSGPTSPEFTSFEPIGTTGMVNEFNGTFTYNLPLLEVPGPSGSGYPISLAYHSGAALEEDATWVGFGWSLNPGAINRSVRGFPDDYNGHSVTRLSKQDKNETFAIGGVVSAQVMSSTLFSFDVANRWNTFTGFSVTTGFSLSVANMLTLTATTQNGVTKFGANVNWATLFTKALTDELATMAKRREQLSDAGCEDLADLEGSRMAKIEQQVNTYSAISSYIGSSFYTMSSPTSTVNSGGAMYAISFGATIAFEPSPTMIGAHVGVKGSYSWQKPDNEQVANAYGYLYDGGANPDASFTDYSVEREVTYTTRDRYLYGVHNTYDVFNCNAQGVGGMLRLHHRKPGYNAPRRQYATKGQYTVGVELGFGPAKISAGAEISVGGGISSTGGALPGGNTVFANANRHEKVGRWNNGRAVMRFANDKADNVRFASKTEGEDRPMAFNTNLFVLGTVSGLYGSFNNYGTDSLKRPRQSSAVTYRTNREIILDADTTRPRYLSYSSRKSYNEKHLNRNDVSIKDGIGEIAVTQTSGMRYVFGLPVYARNERNLTFSGRSAFDSTYTKHGIIYGRKTSTADNVSGFMKQQSYASSMLLTEVRTPDYIDRSQNGPSTDDYGGVTHFMYRRAAGSTQKDSDNGSAWYKWRTPYQGYAYEPGRITAQQDNRASVAMGERELYYLSCIETKTHTAFFVTNKTDTTLTVGGQSYRLKGSGNERKDAYEAYNTGNMDGDESVCGNGPGANNTINTALDKDSAGEYRGESRRIGGRYRSSLVAIDEWLDKPSNNRPNKSEYLERIVLLARDPNGTGHSEIVKTVHLEYTYESMAKTWNGGYLDNYEWSERLGKHVVTASVAAWDTTYPITGHLNSAVVLSKRGLHPLHTGNRLTACRQGKLTLKRLWTDYGKVKSALISPYEFQYTYRNTRSQAYPGEITDNAHYTALRNHDAAYTDPTLDADWKVDSASQKYQNPEYDPVSVDPWGGYRPDGSWAATRMMHHLNQGTTGGQNNFDPAAWQLKLIRLPSGGEIHVHYEQNTYSYVQDQPVMALVPLDSSYGNTHVINCSSIIDVNAVPNRTIGNIRQALQQYLQGGNRCYFKFLYPVMECGSNLNGDYIPSSASEYITGYATAAIPPQTTGLSNAKISFTGSITPLSVLEEFVFNQNNEFRICSEGNVRVDGQQHPSGMGLDSWQKLASAGGAINNNGANVRAYINSISKPFLQRSYIRIPCIWKYGGGVRVKRIFMYDKGIENGRAAIYGSEYDYTINEKGVQKSSGVATNEPAIIREENPLVKFMVGRNEPSWIEKLAAGEDLDQLEGPMCPSVYPAPSIGYSRVTVKNIVQTGSTPGFTVTEFNTAKDFPVIESYTPMKSMGFGLPAIPIGFVTAQKSEHVASQGFCVLLNQMHGTLKRVRKCAGLFSADESKWNVVESVEHEYFKPGSEVPVMYQDGANTKIKMAEMGTDMDISMETREVSDFTASGSLPFDIGLLFPFFFFGHVAPPSMAIAETKYRFAVATKVVTYSTFEKRVTLVRDGMIYVTENAAFDEATGNPVIQKTFADQLGNTDGAGTVQDVTMNYQLPAWTMYAQMGAQSVNEGAQVSGTVATPGGSTMTFTPTEPGALTAFYPGDLVHFSNSGSTAHAYAHVISKTSSLVNLEYAHGTSSLGFTTGSIATIIRSGLTNQLTPMAASVSRHGAPEAEVGQTIHFTAHSVLGANATTYSDVWNYGDLVDFVPYSAQQVNAYERGTKGKWRPDASYVYRDTTASPLSNARIGKSGRTVNQFTGFPFASPSTRDTTRWVRSTLIEAYNQHGDVVMERDAIGVPSCAMFSHSASVPSIICKNAEYGSAAFLSFEDDSNAETTTKHTGKKSRLIGTALATLCSLDVDTRLRDAGLIVRAWTQVVGPATCVVTIGGTTLSAPVELANVAGWRLLEWKVQGNTGPLSSSAIKVVEFNRSSGTSLYVDDVRIQPLDAEATCYVYDAATLRLVAQFDDQHFAAIYKYDDQGRLKRKERETERGIVPLQEAHNNTPSIAHAKRQYPWNDPSMRLATQPTSGGFPSGGMQTGPAKMGGKIDALELKLSPDKQRIRLFEGKETDVPNLDSIVRSMPKLNSNDSLKKLKGGRHEK